MDAKPDDIRIQPVMVGQVAGLLNEIKPAAQVVEEMVAGAEAIFERVGNFQFA
jgi:NAD(P)H-dependent flavin oxidoreductase YrpB (nitropropane dioxygenase family)